MAKEKRTYDPRDVLLSLCADLLTQNGNSPDVKTSVVEALEQIGLELPKDHDKDDNLTFWLRDKGAIDLWADYA